MNPNALADFVSTQWDQEIVPQLIEYIRIPCKSPHFDPHWERNGHVDADDGYAVFACLSAILALHRQGIAHARCVGMIECCEESGSYDLPAYLEALRVRVGKVDLVIGLDSGCGNYDQLWVTTSLRGIAAGTLSVEVLTEGVHSGDASGVVPSSFRIARLLLDRVEDSSTGQILAGEFHCAIPPERIAQAQQAGAILGDTVWTKFPFAAGTRPMVRDPGEAVLNRTWRPFLAVVGADGLPAIADAGRCWPRTRSIDLLGPASSWVMHPGARPPLGRRDSAA
jgi:hypothetical protein